MAKRTPLYDKHVKYGGVIVDFAGYELPVRYPSGIIAEHKTVRNGVGMFDVSHMGEIIFRGKGAEDALEHLLTNKFRDMYDGQVRYSLMLNEEGGEVDDVLVYRFCEGKYLVVVNASNKDKDYAWMTSHIEGYDVECIDISDSVAQIAVQGPLAENVIKKLMAEEDIPVKYYSFRSGVKVAGKNTIVSRTGYTGEKGYEVYCDPKDAGELFEAFIEAGAEYGLAPCGLGARDTLRMEAGMPLYGHELGEDYLATEVGLGFGIKLDKSEFIGKTAIESKPKLYSRIGVRVADKGIVREHTDIYDEEGNLVGLATSGTMAPTVGQAVAMARVLDSATGTLYADVRGKKLKLERVALPFYTPKK